MCADAEEVDYQVTAGDVVVESNQFVAARHGALLSFPGGLTIAMQPAAKFTYFGKKELWVDKDGKRTVHLMHLSNGRLDVSVDDRQPSAVPIVVRTPHKLVSVVRAGTLSAFVQGGSAFANAGGTMEVARRNGWEALVVGKLIVKRQGESITRALRRAQAPEIRAERRVWTGIKGDARVFGFSWTAVPGATGYRSWIIDTTTQQKLHERRTESTRMDPVRLPAGSYELRVQAFDAYGFAGEASTGLPFAVVGFEPGRENYIDSDGVVRVGNDRKAVFTNTTGLELTYGSAGPWVEAPSELLFRRTDRTVVRFRYPGAEGIVAIPVAQQRVSAEIRLGPKRAAWPRDDVFVVVHLDDAVGGGAALRLKPLIEVQLGIQELELEWRREGNTYRARVPEPVDAGPWVVRVTVRHPSGRLLARDLLEVVPGATAEATIVSSL